MRSFTRLAGTLVPALVCALALAATVGAQCTLAKLTEAQSNAVDAFGSAVALQGDTALIRELREDEGGAVHVYVHVGAPWLEVGTLRPGDAAPGQAFGNALAFDDPLLLAGAVGDAEHGADAGAAYVFARRDQGTPLDPLDDAWLEMAKLYPIDPVVPVDFGASVALAADTALIGAPGGSNDGAAYVFVRDGQGTPTDPFDDVWIQQASLASQQLVPGNDFGRAVALSDDGTLAMVGHPSSVYGEVGSVEVFLRVDTGGPGDPLDDEWWAAGWFSPPNGTLYRFGSALALEGDTLMAFDDFGNIGGLQVTVVRVWERDDGGTPADPWDDQWLLAQTLMPPMSHAADFGIRLELQGDRALVGWTLIQGLHWPLPLPGSAVTYERSGGLWTQADTLHAPDGIVGDGVGGALALSGSTVLLGAPGHGQASGGNPPVKGATYVVDLDALDPWWRWGATPYGPSIGGWGQLAEDEQVAVRLYNTWWDSRPVALVVGLSRVDLPFKGGVLVPAPDLVLWLLTTPDGDLTLSARWFDEGVIPSGTEFWFQFWLPDYDGPGQWVGTGGLSATQP